MMFPTTSAFFALACATLAVIPGVRSVNISVTVGGPGILRYNPQFVTANPGDVVVFTFMQKNHTVTESTFAQPCTHLSDGFDSGFVPVADSLTEGFPTATLTIKDTNPIWVYCRQTGHCGQGMVFAVNPTSAAQFAAFQAAANATANATASATATASVITVTETVTVSAGASSAGAETFTTTYASYPGSAAPTVATSTDHRVVVGGSTLTYSPSNITAQPGDTVTFEFHGKNHTVTQSSFATPCEALSLTSTTGEVGFDSGFMGVSANQTDNFPTFTIQINDTKPIWAYCQQLGHCGQGMVFSVNAVEDGPNNFDAFHSAAIAQNGSNSPGASNPVDSGAASFNANRVHIAGVVMTLVASVAGLLL